MPVMKRFGVAVAVWLIGCAAALAQQTGPIYCGASVSVALGAATLTTVVPAPAGGSAKFYLCGYSVSAVAASVVTFSYGTGTNCGTTNVAFGPTIQLGATSTNVDSSPMYRGFLSPPAGISLTQQNLCATATTAGNITVYYAQQ